MKSRGGGNVGGGFGGKVMIFLVLICLVWKVGLCQGVTCFRDSSLL